MIKKNQSIISAIAKHKSIHLLIPVVLWSSFPARAADIQGIHPTNFIRSSTIFGLPLLSDDDNFAIGLGVAFSTNPFKGADDDVAPFPEISYQNGNFSIDFGGVGYTVYSTDNCAITLLGSWRSAPYDSDDSSFLKGMEERDFAIEGGAAISMETFFGDIEITALSDVTNHHKGQIITARYSVPIGGESWVVAPVAGVEWQTEKIIDYYYGVRQSEVRDDRPLYDGKATFTPFIGLDGVMQVYDAFSLQGSINYAFPGSGITDSPLIEDDYILSAALSLRYSF